MGHLLGDFYNTTARGLRDKLGPVLFPLPPRLAHDAEQLARTLACRDQASVNILKFRHSSWWRPEAYGALRQRGVVFGGQSHPLLPDTVVATSPTLHYRLYGVPDLYASSYPAKFLRHVAAEVATAPDGAQAYLHFNNSIGDAAIGNVRAMQQLTAAPGGPAAQEAASDVAG